MFHRKLHAAIFFSFLLFWGGQIFAGPIYPGVPKPEEYDLDYFMEGLDPYGREMLHGQMCPSQSTREFNAGFFTYPVGSADDAIRGVLIQTNGGLVASGRQNNALATPTGDDFMIARFFEDGAIDTGFATNGIQYVSFTGSAASEVSYGVLQQTDGKLLAFGKSDVGGAYLADFAIVRLETAGQLDTTFKTTGKVTASFTISADVARAGLIDINNIVLAGYAWQNPGLKYAGAIARFNSDGILDTSFNTTGKTTIAVASSSNIFYSVAAESGGTNKYVAAGTGRSGSDFDFIVVRLNWAGNLDTTFNTSGKLQFTIGTGNDIAWAMKLDSSNRPLLAGESVNSNSDFAFARVRTDGVLDTTFYTNGKRVFTMGTGNDVVYSLFLDSSEAIIGSGSYHNGADLDFATARLTTDGVLDSSFNTVGKAFQGLGGNNDVAVSVVIGTGSWGYMYIVAGRSSNGTDQDLAIVRYSADGSLACSGCLDPSFGTD